MPSRKLTPFQLQQIVEKAGGRYAKVLDEMVFFSDPQSGAVTYLPVEDLTIENAWRALREARAEAQATLAERIAELRYLRTEKVADRPRRLAAAALLMMALANLIIAWKFVGADTTWVIAHLGMAALLVGLWTLTRNI